MKNYVHRKIFYLLVSIALCMCFLINKSHSQRMKHVIKEPRSSEHDDENRKQPGFFSQEYTAAFMKNIVSYAFRISREVNITSTCSKGISKLFYGIKERKIWAFKMLDSSGKIPSGLFMGSIVSLGDYDECLSISVPNHFQGQYCAVDIFPILTKRLLPAYSKNMDSIKEIKDDKTIETVMEVELFKFANPRTSVCVPSTCSAEDIKELLSAVLKQTGTDFNVSIPNCETKVDKIVFSNTQMNILNILLILLLLAICATVIDVFRAMTTNDEIKSTLSIPVKCLLCFSFYTNIRRLLKKDDSRDTIKIFHGIKFITTLWVILNHTYLNVNYHSGCSLLEVTRFQEDFWFEIVLNGFLNVQTFFFMSAVLIGYGVMKLNIQKINIFLYIFRRIWRLTPAFMLVIACVFLLPPLGSGPVWKETVTQYLTENCQANWWTNLLYINNFVPHTKMCLDWYWYIAVDTQLYILSLIVIIPMKQNPRLAFTINGILFLLGTLITAISNVYYDLPPTGIYVNPESSDYFLDYGYFRTYLHISTYCVGLTVGYILATKETIQLSLFTNICGWTLSFIVPFMLIFGAYEWNQGNLPNMLITILYACFNKFLWSLALAWITITCMTGNGGIVTKFLSWQGFVPLARLTYMTYLVHPIIQRVYMGSTKTALKADHRTAFMMYFAYILLSYMSAFFLGLLFESPFMALDKLFIEYLQRKKYPQTKNFECGKDKRSSRIIQKGD